MNDRWIVTDVVNLPHENVTFGRLTDRYPRIHCRDSPLSLRG